MKEKKFIWIKEQRRAQTIWRCSTKETTVELWPRPPYCDRGRWEAHIDCPGFPENPKPFDSADMFPRYFFSLERAKAEMEDLFNFRGYEPNETSSKS